MVRLTKGVEVHKTGSGRIGTTNVYRVVGPLGAVLTSFGDVTKGVLAVWIARALTGSPWVEAAAGIAAIAGHNWSVFLGFRGGAGTLTTMGVLAAMNPYIVIVLTVLAITALIISRMASVASLTIALLMGPVLAAFAALRVTTWAYIPFGIVSGALTIYALRPNIERILKGQERRLKTNS